MDQDTQQTLEIIAQTIYDKKGFNILALDVRKVCTFTDYFIIAEGNIDRHVRGIAKEMTTVLKKQGIRPLVVEGADAADWMVVDYGEIMVHLFTPQMRQKYQLERIWDEGKVVDLAIEVSEVG